MQHQKFQLEQGGVAQEGSLLIYCSDVFEIREMHLQEFFKNLFIGKGCARESTN